VVQKGRLARLALLVSGSLSVACSERLPGGPDREDAEEARRAGEARRAMVELIRQRGVRDERVLAALGRIPREDFVPGFRGSMDEAYGDFPLAIGSGQTISQPYVVAYMTAALELEPGMRVLEVGTGSGYQAAVLGELVERVFTIEIVPELAEHARLVLERNGYGNVSTRLGDGYRGWPEVAPFDAILVTAAPEHVPEPLVDQLAPGGRMILPVGGVEQELVLVRRRADGSVEREAMLPVRFVPMTGEALGGTGEAREGTGEAREETGEARGGTGEAREGTGEARSSEDR